VQTEARIAKALVKQTLRDAGYKISAFDNSELHHIAKDVLRPSNADLYKTAKRTQEPSGLCNRRSSTSAAMLGSVARGRRVKAKPKVPPKPKGKARIVLLCAQKRGISTSLAIVVSSLVVKRMIL